MMNDTGAMRDFMSNFIKNTLYYQQITFFSIPDTCNSLSKISRECVMRITSDKLYFIISDEDAGPSTPLVWCELVVGYYFKEYNVVGMNEQYNEIYLEFASGIRFPFFIIISADKT